MKHPTITTTESSLSSKRGSALFVSPIGGITTTKPPEVRRMSLNTNNNIIKSLSGIHNRSTLLDLTLEDEESEESDPVIEKTTTNLKKTKTRISVGVLSTQSSETSKAYLEDFKKFIKNKQKIQQSKTILEEDLNQFNSTIHNNNTSDHNNNEENPSSTTNLNNYSPTSSRTRIKMSTLKVMIEIRKKLKLQNKSKAEKFEESMQLFKGTDTYIEIKPFLEQLNLLNHQKYIQEVNRYEKNIQQAKEYQQHEELMKKIFPGDNNQGNGGHSGMSHQDKKMKHFKDILIKANNLSMNSKQQLENKMLANLIQQQLITELGLGQSQQGDDFDDNNNTEGEEEEIKRYNESRNKSKKKQKKKIILNNSRDGERKISQELQSSFYPTAVNPLSLNKNDNSMIHLHSQNVSKTHENQQQKQQLDAIDLQTDENQFFINLQGYLSKAQKDINLRNEIETENNTYALIIKENQDKLNEAKILQMRRFGCIGGQQFNPDSLFQDDKNVGSDKFYERFHEKSEQVRLTLNKVNQELFQQKWANAQMKQKMERQKERNQILSSFNQSKVNTNSGDLLNPSKKMNESILKRRQQINEQAGKNAQKVTDGQMKNQHRLIISQREQDINDTNRTGSSRQRQYQYDGNAINMQARSNREDYDGDNNLEEQSQQQQNSQKYQSPQQGYQSQQRQHESILDSPHKIQSDRSISKINHLSSIESSHMLKGQQQLGRLISQPSPISHTITSNSKHMLSSSSFLRTPQIMMSPLAKSKQVSSLSPTRRQLFNLNKQLKLPNNRNDISSDQSIINNINTNNTGNFKRNMKQMNNQSGFNNTISGAGFDTHEHMLPRLKTEKQDLNGSHSLKSLLTPLKKSYEFSLTNPLMNTTSSRNKHTQQTTAQYFQTPNQMIQSKSQGRFRLPLRTQIISKSNTNGYHQQFPQGDINSVTQSYSNVTPPPAAVKIVESTEEQQRMEQLIQEIDEERQEYNQQKGQILEQLTMIDQNYDKEMQKYHTEDQIESLRGVSIPFNDNSSPASGQNHHSFKMKNMKAHTKF